MTPDAVSERERKVLDIIETVRGKRPKFKDAAITMAHGAGGKATQTLIEGLFVPAFGSEAGAAMADAGAVGDDLGITTDSFVVSPLRFPGGSIGDLAVNGTVNDLAMAGARPLALSLALILEEGLDASVLRAEVEAMAAAAAAAGVRIVAGDTKVVERGHADGMYVCTTGVGRRDPRAALAPSALRPGDRILVSGPIGAHGTAIMLARGELGLDADIESHLPRSTTFVSPAMISTPAARAAAAIASTSARRSSAERPSSSTKERVSASGSAPAMARSLTVPLTASSPIDPPGKRSGLTTNASVVSASSPTAAASPSSVIPNAGASSPSTSLRVALPPAPWAMVMRSSRNLAGLDRAVSMIPRIRSSRESRFRSTLVASSSLRATLPPPPPGHA